jgi:hypothetical protein
MATLICEGLPLYQVQLSNLKFFSCYLKDLLFKTKFDWIAWPSLPYVTEPFTNVRP